MGRGLEAGSPGRKFAAAKALPKGRVIPVRSKDGIRLHTEVFGPEDGYPIVLAHGITCNALCPGTTETPVHEATILASMREGLSRAESERRLLAGKQPTGKLIAADEVAALIEFLCGPESASITGAVLPVDGGWSST